jgi:hypothetical protein
MMHRRGESDSAIVAGKPTNKVERSAAEPVEPRAEAKGNARQQSTDRTQSRGTVSQALERIRQAARQRKKEKFTALLHHISIDLLDEAFFELRKDAAPGVDGLIWTDYEQNLERNLDDLHARIHRGAYRALPSRRTYIPKPDGRQRTAAAHASVDPRTGKVAEAGRHRLLQLSRGADKRSDADCVSFPRHQPMATHAAAAKSEGLDDQGTDRAVGQRLAPKTANPSPLAGCALCSQTPKVGAVCPNWARTALCGGREVTQVPTAIQGHSRPTPRVLPAG